VLEWLCVTGVALFLFVVLVHLVMGVAHDKIRRWGEPIAKQSRMVSAKNVIVSDSSLDVSYLSVTEPEQLQKMTLIIGGYLTRIGGYNIAGWGLGQFTEFWRCIWWDGRHLETNFRYPQSSGTKSCYLGGLQSWSLASIFHGNCKLAVYLPNFRTYPSTLVQSHGFLSSCDGRFRGFGHHSEVLFGLPDFCVSTIRSPSKTFGSGGLFVGGFDKFVGLFAAANILKDTNDKTAKSKESNRARQQNHQFLTLADSIFKIIYSISLGLVGYLLCVWAGWVIWRRWDTRGLCYGLLMYGIAGLIVYHVLILWI
jgi:hypothetical protein